MYLQMFLINLYTNTMRLVTLCMILLLFLYWYTLPKVVEIKYPVYTSTPKSNGVKPKVEYIDFYQHNDFEDLDINPDDQVAILRDIEQNNKKGTRDVHSSTIQNVLSKDFKQTHKSTNGSYSGLYSYYPKNVHSVLDELDKREIKMVMYNDKYERDILLDTFSNGDKKVKDALFITLTEFKNEGLRCSTGNVSRILECKYINDPEKIPLDEKSLNAALLNRAAQLSNDMSYDDIKESLRKEYSKYSKAVDKILSNW